MVIAKHTEWAARLVLAAAALLLAAAAGAQGTDYLSDARTARAVEFGSPRATLGSCLRALSDAAGVKLEAAPELAEEPLAGAVPRRPLRETMAALEELYDAAWTGTPGAAPAYRLGPDPGKAGARATARAAQFRRYRERIDGAAADVAHAAPAERPEHADGRLQARFALLLWSYLPSASRDQVLHGTPARLSLPAEKAGAAYRWMIVLSRQNPAPLRGPVLASFDLDDPDDTAMPVVRVHATALRAGSVVGSIGAIPFAGEGGKVQAAVNAEGSPTLPVELGTLTGTREEVLLRLAASTGVPILSRHRAIGGSCGVTVGGRRLAEAVAGLATACEATLHVNSRGFQLFRSATELLDDAGRPDPAVIAAYLARRPRLGETVSLAALSELSRLSPYQLSVLERSNVCTSDAHAARELYSVLQFYRSLSAPQQAEFQSMAGLDAGTLPHLQLHLLLAGKERRSEWDLETPLQRLDGLRLRAREAGAPGKKELLLEAVRDGTTLRAASSVVPEVEPEDQPAAAR